MFLFMVYMLYFHVVHVSLKALFFLYMLISFAILINLMILHLFTLEMRVFYEIQLYSNYLVYDDHYVVRGRTSSL